MMGDQSRHQKGAPASQGGRFAATDRPAGTTALVDQEQPLSDLGVTGQLTPYLADEPWQEGGPAWVGPGAQVYTSNSGRQIILDIQDGRVNATSRTADKQWERTGGHWSEQRDGSTTDVIAAALHAAATVDIFAQQMRDGRGQPFELRDTLARVYSSGGDLFTEVDVTAPSGERTSIGYWHGTEHLMLDRNHETLEGDAAEEFLTTSAGSLLHADSWQEMFRTAAHAMADDEDILPQVREAAIRAGANR